MPMSEFRYKVWDKALGGDPLRDLAPGLDRLAVAELQRLAYAPLDDVEGLDMEELISALERWIQEHRGAHA